jgi:hypothetical protein
MPTLSRAKEGLGKALGSAAMQAGAAGRLLRVSFGDPAGQPFTQWWARMVWADPVAGIGPGSNHREGRIYGLSARK